MSGPVDDALGVLRKALARLRHDEELLDGRDFVAERHDEFDAAVDVLAGELAKQQEWIDRVSLGSTEAATAADKAERERDVLAVQVEQLREALRQIADRETAPSELRRIARAALEAGPASLADGLSKREPRSTAPAPSAGNEQ